MLNNTATVGVPDCGPYAELYAPPQQLIHLISGHKRGIYLLALFLLTICIAFTFKPWASFARLAALFKSGRLSN